MDDRDAQAVDRGIVRSLAAMFVFWMVFVVIPLAIGGFTHADAAVVAGVALLPVGAAHAIRLTGRSGRTVTSGPLTGLGAADASEVMDAVRKGRAVSDPRLASPAVAYARQQLRWRGFSRIGLPVLIGLRAVDLVLNPPEGAKSSAHWAVTTAPLLVLAVMSFVSFRRAEESVDLNLSLQATVKPPASAVRDN